MHEGAVPGRLITSRRRGVARREKRRIVSRQPERFTAKVGTAPSPRNTQPDGTKSPAAGRGGRASLRASMPSNHRLRDYRSPIRPSQVVESIFVERQLWVDTCCLASRKSWLMRNRVGGLQTRCFGLPQLAVGRASPDLVGETKRLRNETTTASRCRALVQAVWLPFRATAMAGSMLAPHLRLRPCQLALAPVCATVPANSQTSANQAPSR